MEFEQIIKRIDWLEKQQRKTSETADAVKEQLPALEREAAALNKKIKSLEKELAEVTATAARLNQFDAIFAKQRADMAAAIERIEKKAQKRELELSKRSQTEFEKLSRGIVEARNSFDLTDIHKQLQLSAAEDIRISQALTDIRTRAEEIAATHEQMIRAQKAFDESRRTDA